jgi:hypothetical protein
MHCIVAYPEISISQIKLYFIPLIFLILVVISIALNGIASTAKMVLGSYSTFITIKNFSSWPSYPAGISGVLKGDSGIGIFEVTWLKTELGTKVSIGIN